jgi:two-component system NtrC family sensor kinase
MAAAESTIGEKLMAGERILVVDDEERIVRLCTRTLTRKGYAAEGLTSGTEAITLLRKESFELLVADIKMPDMDGLTLLRKAREIVPDIAVAIITGYATLDSTVEALRAGARGFLLKPFSPQEFLLMVEEALSERRKEEERLRLRVQIPILEVAHTLVSEGDVDHTARRLLEAVALEMEAHRAILMLLDEKSGELLIAATVGVDSPETAKVRIPLGSDRPGQRLPREDPTLLRGVTGLEPSIQELLGTDIASTAIVPLHTRRTLIGEIYLGRLPSGVPFNAIDHDLLPIIGSQVATTLENARLYEAVSRGKREWEITFDALADGIFIHDGEFRIIRANKALARHLGTQPEALIGQPCYRAIHQMDQPPETCPSLLALSSGQEQHAAWQDSTLKGFFQFSAYPLHDEHDHLWGIVHVLKDITEQKRMQDSLIQAEKLAAKGRLVASLAHEINNPLHALRRALHLLSKGDVDSEKQQHYLKSASREVERLITIVDRVLAFYQPSSEQAELVDPNTILKETMALVEKRLEQSRVTVSHHFSSEIPAVEGAADDLRQAFLNLLLNALQAMPDGGILKTETRYNQGTGEVEISFTDTGGGIPEEQLAHLFEAFHTTRLEGTGLGLAISYSIIERNGGRIEVQSQAGEGSSFTVVLPASEGDRGQGKLQ